MSTTLPQDWKLLSSEYLYKHQWLTVRRDVLQLANGHVIPNYFVLEYANWINVIAITKEGEYLLIQQYRHGLGKTSYELTAGVVDPEDPNPLHAAKRELMEETGYGGGDWQELMTIAPNPATANNWTYCFLATGVEKLNDQALEPSEQITVHLVKKEELKELMQNGSMIQALHLCPLWKHLWMEGNK